MVGHNIKRKQSDPIWVKSVCSCMFLCGICTGIILLHSSSDLDPCCYE